MARFSDKNRAQLRELTAELDTVRANGPPVFETMLPQLRALLGLDLSMFYDVRQEEGRFSLERILTDQFPVPQNKISMAFGGLLNSSTGRWGVFDPTRPEPQQRNLSQVHPPLSLVAPKALAPIPDWLHNYGLSRSEEARYAVNGLGGLSQVYKQMGIRDLWQLRVLVCEQESMLAWVGGFSEAPPTEEARRLLNSLVPSLRRRLLLERTLDRGPMVEASLAATMEAIPSSAFLVSAAGLLLLQANTAGQAELEREPSSTRRSIAEAVRPGADGGPFQITKVTAVGRNPVYLLVGHAPVALEQRLAILVRRWSLTKRQAQVLDLVARGDANRTIAARFNLGERTIELHVAALLAKAGAESRSALIARFFMGG